MNTYFRELLDDTCRIANALKRSGVKKGDRICIYMPVSPMAVACMLACTRIGAVHRYVLHRVFWLFYFDLCTKTLLPRWDSKIQVVMFADCSSHIYIIYKKYTNTLVSCLIHWFMYYSTDLFREVRSPYSSGVTTWMTIYPLYFLYLYSFTL